MAFLLIPLSKISFRLLHSHAAFLGIYCLLIQSLILWRLSFIHRKRVER